MHMIGGISRMSGCEMRNIVLATIDSGDALSCISCPSL